MVYFDVDGCFSSSLSTITSCEKVSKARTFLKILRRTLILFVLGKLIPLSPECYLEKSLQAINLGLTTNDDLTRLENLQIPGVLQRLNICFYSTALLISSCSEMERKCRRRDNPVTQK